MDNRQTNCRRHDVVAFMRRCFYSHFRYAQRYAVRAMLRVACEQRAPHKILLPFAVRHAATLSAVAAARPLPATLFAIAYYYSPRRVVTRVRLR